MFIVFNKQKIYSYIIALSTVVILFSGATFFTNVDRQTIQTSASANKLLPIYSVETNEKNIAITINCAWSQHQMG